MHSLRNITILQTDLEHLHLQIECHYDNTAIESTLYHYDYMCRS